MWQFFSLQSRTNEQYPKFMPKTPSFDYFTPGYVKSTVPGPRQVSFTSVQIMYLKNSINIRSSVNDGFIVQQKLYNIFR